MHEARGHVDVDEHVRVFTCGIALIEFMTMRIDPNASFLLIL